MEFKIDILSLNTDEILNVQSNKLLKEITIESDSVCLSALLDDNWVECLRVSYEFKKIIYFDNMMRGEYPFMSFDYSLRDKLLVDVLNENVSIKQMGEYFRKETFENDDMVFYLQDINQTQMEFDIITGMADSLKQLDEEIVLRRLGM